MLGRSGHQFPRFHLIYIAPHPGFPGFDGADERVLGLMEVLGGVLVLGRIAAANVAADQAKTKMYPGISHLHALFTDVIRGLTNFDLIKMLAGFRHDLLLQVVCSVGIHIWVSIACKKHPSKQSFDFVKLPALS
jgi:hypothetical protein